MGITLRLVRPSDDRRVVRGLVGEYVEFVDGVLRRDHGLRVYSLGDGLLTEIDSMVSPPGRLYVATINEHAVGMGGLKPITADVAEIKRMYVRPVARRRGVARCLLQQLLADGAADGYRTLVLESAAWMTGAHALYRGFGFVDAGGQGEIVRSMELDLRAAACVR